MTPRPRYSLLAMRTLRFAPVILSVMVAAVACGDDASEAPEGAADTTRSAEVVAGDVNQPPPDWVHEEDTGAPTDSEGSDTVAPPDSGPGKTPGRRESGVSSMR